MELTFGGPKGIRYDLTMSFPKDLWWMAWGADSAEAATMWGTLLKEEFGLKDWKLEDSTAFKEGLESVKVDWENVGKELLLSRILRMADNSLRRIIRAKPTQEKEIEYAFISLLVGGEIDFQTQTESIPYSSKFYRPDVTVPSVDLAVEFKLCKDVSREKILIAELNDDLVAYRTKFSKVLFVIYDLGFIRDTQLFSSSFEKTENVFVSIVKH